MRIQWFILLFVLFAFFKVIQAAEDPISVKASKDSVSVDQVEPFFSHLNNSLFYQNIYNEEIFRPDFSLAIKLFRNFPFQTLKVVNSFGSREFIFFFAALIYIDGLCINSPSRTGERRRRDDIHFTFRTLDYLIGGYIKYSLEWSDVISSKEMLSELLPILKSVGCLPSVDLNSPFYWNYFKTEAMSTKVFIQSYAHFIENLEDDCVIGFENAYYKLKHLSSYHKGVIPSQEGSKSRIFSLLYSCAYYAKIIMSKIFVPLDSKTTDSSPLESEMTDSSLLDPKTTDPGALSFFLGLFNYNSFESLFSSCGSVDKKSATESFFLEEFKRLFYFYKFESHQHRYSLLPKILEKLDAKGQWGFKVYLKLVYGISI